MNLKPGSHVHLMGICGTAMASLAGLLKDRGYKVTGSDANPYPPMSTQIESLGIQIQTPYCKENLHPHPDLVIVGNVITAKNEEAIELARLGLPFTSLPKAMGEWIIADRQCICISGTHGKTTTTSLMTWVVDQLGFEPGYLIGGIPKNFNFSFRNGKAPFFVIEGDEYDTAYFDKVPKFIHYKPRHVVLTSIEFDHADIYPDLTAVKKAFEMLLKLIPREGHLIYWGEDPNIRAILAATTCANVFSYGFKNSDYLVKNVEHGQGTTGFEIYHRERSLGRFEVNLSGDYNVLNAASVVALNHQLGHDLDRVKSSFKSFQGVKRRQEILGEPRGVLVIEDFAHHPTAVRETIRGIAEKYPQRKIFAVFEPRSATSRRKVFQKDYAEAFAKASEVLIAKAYNQTSIDSTDRFSSEELVADLLKKGKSARCLDHVDSIVSDLKSQVKKGDLILIMSNGGFDGIYKKLLDELNRGL